jgi:hypothetical protein
MLVFMSTIFDLSPVINTRFSSIFGEEFVQIGELNFVAMSKKNMIVELLLDGGFPLINPLLMRSEDLEFLRVPTESHCVSISFVKIPQFLTTFLGLALIILICQKLLRKI